MPRYKKLNKFKPFDSNTICDETGFKKKLSETMQRWDGFRVIPEAWNPQQPQDFPPNINKPIFYPESRSEQSYPSLFVRISGYLSVIYNTNPSGWWPFNEGSGNVAKDWSQILDNESNAGGDGANNGIADSGVLVTGDEGDGYADFDGTTKITLNNIRLGSARGVQVWIGYSVGGVIFCEGDIREATTEPGGIPKGYDLSFYNTDDEDYGIELYYYDSDSGVFRTVNFNAFDYDVSEPGEGDYVSASISFSGFNAGDVVTAWLNGVIIGTHSITGQIQNSALPRLVGSDYAGNGYSGNMKNFALYDNELTDSLVDGYVSGVNQEIVGE